jgi:hypothetical protein
MKYIISILLLSTCLFAECGTERWPIKTLQDPAVMQAGIDGMAHVNATVDQLRALPRPRRLYEIKRSSPVENTIYTVPALLIGFMLEHDLDFHVVIADQHNPSHTMIAEIPQAVCANPQYAPLFDAARRFMLKNVGRPRVKNMIYLPAPVPFTITGVGFFDKRHGRHKNRDTDEWEKGQIGIAPNAIELHPVIGIK